MPYSDFDLRKARNELGIAISEQEHLFAAFPAAEIGAALREILAENIPLARAINTEKARSELLIAPILVELRKSFYFKIEFK